MHPWRSCPVLKKVEPRIGHCRPPWVSLGQRRSMRSYELTQKQGVYGVSNIIPTQPIRLGHGEDVSYFSLSVQRGAYPTVPQRGNARESRNDGRDLTYWRIIPLDLLFIMQVEGSSGIQKKELITEMSCPLKIIWTEWGWWLTGLASAPMPSGITQKTCVHCRNGPKDNHENDYGDDYRCRFRVSKHQAGARCHFTKMELTLVGSWLGLYRSGSGLEQAKWINACSWLWIVIRKAMETLGSKSLLVQGCHAQKYWVYNLFPFIL